MTTHKDQFYIINMSYILYLVSRILSNEKVAYKGLKCTVTLHFIKKDSIDKEEKDSKNKN